MRATPDQRDTSDLKQDATDLAETIVEKASALVNTGCVVAYVGTNQEEAQVLTLEMNQAVHEREEILAELAERGE